ncbi:MAG: HAD family phosphatase [Candidatus Levyibacteriota bacterium]
MIKAIIFDHGGVLSNYLAPGVIAYASKKLSVPRKKFLKALSKYKPSFQKGEISEKEFWQKITTGLNLPMPKVRSFWLDAVLSTYNPRKDIFLLVKQLKKQGYKIALLSNTELPVANYVKEKKWENFDLFIFSCEVGMIKPDKKIYKLALEKLNVMPEEVVYIDDKEKNVQGAINSGMHGILFTTKNNFVKELIGLGVRVDF